MDESKKKKRGKKGYYNRQRSYRKEALTVAKDLSYGPEVISKINNAKSDAEIERIMSTARKRRASNMES